MGVSASSTSTKSSNTGKTRNVYEDPKADIGFERLTGSAGGGGELENALTAFYRKQLQGGGNPNLPNVISSQNQLADSAYQDRLAQIRSHGFRGGAGRDFVNQAKLAGDFTNQQYANNQQMMFDDYNQGQNRAFAGAGGILGLGSQQLGSASTLLNALRGIDTSGTAKSKSSTVGAEMNIGSLLGAI